MTVQHYESTALYPAATQRRRLPGAGWWLILALLPALVGAFAGSNAGLAGGAAIQAAVSPAGQTGGERGAEAFRLFLPVACRPLWRPAAALQQSRTFHAAARLPDGRVLVSGGVQIGLDATTLLSSTELYDLAANRWTNAAGMGVARAYHSATLLSGGQVLVVGGRGEAQVLDSAEVYDPATNAWHMAASLHTARVEHTSTRLADGRVLVVGGNRGDGQSVASAEVYDPAANTWTEVAPMLAGRFGHSATLLADGRVLVVGGCSYLGSYTCGPVQPELFDPQTQTWRAAAALGAARTRHTATLLADGRVLVAGGWGGRIDMGPTIIFDEAYLYDPLANTWTGAVPLLAKRYAAQAVLLPDGRVLLVGGSGEAASSPLADSEVYDPTLNQWTSVGRLLGARSGHSATLLSESGPVLVTGGWDGQYSLASTELGY